MHSFTHRCPEKSCPARLCDVSPGWKTKVPLAREYDAQLSHVRRSSWRCYRRREHLPAHIYIYTNIYIYKLMLSSAVLGCVLANGASRQPPLGCGPQLRGHSCNEIKKQSRKDTTIGKQPTNIELRMWLVLPGIGWKRKPEKEGIPCAGCRVRDQEG